MTDNLLFTVKAATNLSSDERTKIISLCTKAYEEDFNHLFELFPGSTHIYGQLGDEIVVHAAWVTRWLEPQGLSVLQTAYIEAVATLPAMQGRGFGTKIMQLVKAEISEYELGALSPSEAGFYERLGWEPWRGRLAIRHQNEIQPTPNEEVMIMRLPRTPALDQHSLLTAEWRDGELW